MGGGAVGGEACPTRATRIHAGRGRGRVQTWGLNRVRRGIPKGGGGGRARRQGCEQRTKKKKNRAGRQGGGGQKAGGAAHPTNIGVATRIQGGSQAERIKGENEREREEEREIGTCRPLVRPEDVVQLFRGERAHAVQQLTTAGITGQRRRARRQQGRVKHAQRVATDLIDATRCCCSVSCCSHC